MFLHLLLPLYSLLQFLYLKHQLVDKHLDGAILGQRGVLRAFSGGLCLVELLHGEHAVESFLKRHVGSLLRSRVSALVVVVVKVLELLVGELRLERQRLEQLHLLAYLLILCPQQLAFVVELLVAQAESADGLLEFFNLVEEEEGDIRGRRDDLIVGELQLALQALDGVLLELDGSPELDDLLFVGLEAVGKLYFALVHQLLLYQQNRRELLVLLLYPQVVLLQDRDLSHQGLRHLVAGQVDALRQFLVDVLLQFNLFLELPDYQLQPRLFGLKEADFGLADGGGAGLAAFLQHVGVVVHVSIYKTKQYPQPSINHINNIRPCFSLRLGHFPPSKS